MRCKTCDYTLWNLKARTCPECGAPFRPSEFEFVINSVKFCCPNCGQQYYGTDDRGHLVPDEFTCITCNQIVRMDDMVLLPAEGVREEQTRIEVMPWLERVQIGRLKAWIRTIGLGLLMPVRLMRSVPPESPVGQAWLFAGLTLLAYAVCGWGLVFGAIALVVAIFRDFDDALELLTASLVMTGSISIPLLVFLGIWGVATHGILRLMGATNQPISRTYQALCYSTGAAAVLAVPVMGVYPFGFVPMIWWVICATLMVAEAHRCHGGRAAIATMALPAVLTSLVVAGAIIGVVAAVRTSAAAMTSQRTAAQSTDLTFLADLVLEYSDLHGTMPDHAARLIDHGASATSFVPLGDSGLRAAAIRLGDLSLSELVTMGPNLRREALDRFAAGLPDGLIAHRLGDFVFTYHGIDPAATESAECWLALRWPEPGTGAVPTEGGMVWVDLVEGGATPIPFDTFAAELAAQNDRRAKAGLPPLPHPATITHDSPATAEPAD